MKKDQLFELIKTLTPSEKRYFKIFSAYYENDDKNNYLRLFNFMDQQKEYTQEKLEKHFKGERFLKQLHVSKNYLYKQILKSLRNFHESGSIETEIRNILNEAEILSARGLYDQSERMLNRAEKLAEEYELYVALLDVYFWRSELNYTKGATGYFAEYEEKVYEKEKSFCSTILNQNEYRFFIYSISGRLRSQGRPRKEEQIAFIEKILKHPLMKDEKLATSFSSRLNFLKIKGSYYLIKADFEEAHVYHKKILALIEKHTGQIEIKPEIYLFALNNFVITAIRLKKYTDALNTIGKIKGMTAKYRIKNSADWETKVFSIAAQLETEVYLQSANYKLAGTLEEYVSDGMKRLQSTMNPAFVMILQYNIAYLLFCTKNWSASKKWASQILNEGSKEHRGDVFASAQMLQVLIALEKEDWDHLSHLGTGTRRKLRDKGKLFDTENCLFNFVAAFQKCTKKTEKTELLKNFCTELESLQKNPLEKHLQENLDLVRWAKEKMKTLK